MGNTNDKDTGIKAEEFERRIRRLFSAEAPKSEQDIIRVWLASDEDADLKRDSLCRVMLEQFETDADLDARN